jgi:hypothetical protein
MTTVDKERVTIMREFLLPKLPPGQDASAKSIGKALKNHVGEPVKNHGSETLIPERMAGPARWPKRRLKLFRQCQPIIVPHGMQGMHGLF